MRCTPVRNNLRRQQRAAIFILVCMIARPLAGQQPERFSRDISSNDWTLWPDTAASWEHDTLYAPPVDIRHIPVHLPTGGWEALGHAGRNQVALPATVEQYTWGDNGNSFGVSGNYLGVSWFTTKVDLPPSLTHRRIVLHFGSARFRAEVFVNRILAGYDLVNSTPFMVDITRQARPGEVNEIAVRITDPNGNFDWRDSQNFMWGAYRTIPSHGFGGITGPVAIVATDSVFIDDIFVKNTPDLHRVNAHIAVNNLYAEPHAGTLRLLVRKAGGKETLYDQHYPLTVPPGNSEHTYPVSMQRALPWSVESPHLYEMEVRWQDDRGFADATTQRFGFRWFEVVDANGDRQFRLNGKRIVLRTAISWGFWPVNGIAPSDLLARKQIIAAKSLGLNMLNFHRAIGQQNVLDAADELGLLYFEEPGGNQYPADRYAADDAAGRMQRDFYFAVRNEKLFRMIRRDRSHPSLVIYNMHNERGAPPMDEDREEMRAAHTLDETRILTYNSCNGNISMGPDPKFKLHLLPYDTTFHDFGWFDQHHAGGPGTYRDNVYHGPDDYLRYTDHRDEIIYWGEEGAIGTPPRLQLIRDEIRQATPHTGWDRVAYLSWYDAYDAFLKERGFSSAFPSVDALTRAMGNVAYTYQGRAIENIRISNTADGYAVNGWESMPLENHSGIVDCYRNVKGDPTLIARYNAPLYLAVKMNRKVLPRGDTSVVDLYIVNEESVSGHCILRVTASDSDGSRMLLETPVEVTGGDRYGELLYAGARVTARRSGYTTVSAELRKESRTVARGADMMFAVGLDTSGIPSRGMVADTSGTLAAFLRAQNVTGWTEFRSGRPEGSYLLVGAFEPQQTGNPLVTDILEWVNDGNTLVVIDNTEAWADYLARKEVLDYRGAKTLGRTWYGGNFFSKRHELFAGLPQACVFNWEYQCFAAYNRNRVGLRLFNGEPVVACVSDHKREVYTALAVVPHGRGTILLSTLDIMSCIRSDHDTAGDSTAHAPPRGPDVVGQQVLMNMLRFATHRRHQ